MIYQVLGITSFTLMLFLLAHYREKAPAWQLPSCYFMIFMTIAWSPLSFFPIEDTHVRDAKLSAHGQFLFATTYALMCIGIGIGFAMSRRTFRTKSKLLALRRLTATEERLMDRKLSILAMGTSLFIIALYLSSSELRSHLSDILSYVRSTTLLSYTELRRETIRGGFIMTSVHGRFQYSVIAVLFCLNIVFAYRSRSLTLRTIHLCIAVLLFAVCATTLNKRPYVYYTTLALLSYCIARLTSGASIKKVLTPLAIGAGGIASLLIILYGIQYRDNQTRDLEENLQTAYFRVFLAYPAGYKLYTEIYPDVEPFTYGKSTGLLQPILGAVEQPYTLVPLHFAQGNTTFPSGFISYAYSDWGVPGVIVFSLLCGLLLRWQNHFVLTQNSKTMQIASIVVLGMATNFLCSKSLPSSLLSGGLLLCPALIMFIQKIGRLTSRDAPISHIAKTKKSSALI